MKILALVLFFTVLLSVEARAINYYVSESGNDARDGRSENNAFRNIQRAADLTQPGDTVYVMNGLYTQDDPNSNIVNISRSGTANGWITYRAYPGHTPKFKSKNWQAISVDGASYIVIDGFEIEGNSDSITYAYAYAERSNLNNPLTAGNGIGINKKYNANPPQYPHHVRIANNKVYKCSGGGIYTYNADYVTIEDNIIHDNAYWSPYAGSGISTYQNWNFDNSTASKMFIRRNITFHNKNLIPFFAAGIISDGNGIIVDDLRNTQNNSTLGLYRGRTRVENNISYENGGRGINVYSSDFVDVVNNTTYKNSQSPEINDGEITAFDANDVQAFNNIIYATTGKPANKIYNATNIAFDYNLVFNSNDFTSTLTHNILNQNPLFTNEAERYFLPQRNSPAVNRGTRQNSAKQDIRGVKRPLGIGVDIGAFERWWQESDGSDFE